VERLDDKELICFSCHNLFLYFDTMSRMAVRKERLGGTGFGSADQPEHWAWTDRSNMADGLRRAEFKGAGLGLEVLEWLGSAGATAIGSEMRSRLGKEVPAKEALVKDALAKEALARRPLVRQMMTRERGACQRSAGRRGTELGGVGVGNAGHEVGWAR
jgi:hypothetical protein